MIPSGFTIKEAVNMTIDEMIIFYDCNVVSESEFDDISYDENVMCVEYNGHSSNDPRLEWYTVYFTDGREMDIYF